MTGIRQAEQPPALPRAGRSAARSFVRYAWAVVAYNVAVVLWGDQMQTSYLPVEGT